MIQAPWSGKTTILTYSRNELIGALIVYLIIMFIMVTIQLRHEQRIMAMLAQHRYMVEQSMMHFGNTGIRKRVATIERVIIDKRWLTMYGNFINDLEEDNGETE